MNRRRIIGILTTVALATIAWTTLTIVSHAERLSAVEVQLKALEGWMERVEGKLDRVLER